MSNTISLPDTTISSGAFSEGLQPQGYYPRALVKLTVRLEEYGDGADLAKSTPEKSLRNISGTNPGRTKLKYVVDPSTNTNVTRWLLLPDGETAGPTVGPQVRARSSDNMSFDFAIVPRHMTWKQNGIRRGDTLTFQLKFGDCPMDPRIIRSVAVTALMGCIPEDVHAREIMQGPSGDVLPESWVDKRGVSRTNVRFLGWVDKWRLKIPEKGEPYIEGDCCDNVRLLLVQMMPPRLNLSLTIPLDEAVALYLTQFPQLAGLTVEYQPEGDPPPKLGDILSPTAVVQGGAPAPGGAAAAPIAGLSVVQGIGPTTSRHGGAGGSKFTPWDYLHGVVEKAGRSIYVDGTRIVIQRLRSMTTRSTSRRQGDPFRGRTVNGRDFSYRTFVLGENIRELDFTRDFTRHAPINVEICSYDTRRKTPIKVRFPINAQPSTVPTRAGGGVVTALPGNRTSEQKWFIKWIPGLTDEKTMRAIAQEIYEGLNRNELGVEVKTRSLGSFGGGNDDPDVLDMKFSDRFEVLVNQTDDEVSSVTKLQKSSDSYGSNVALMKSLGFSDELANAYARQYTNAGFTTFFLLREMTASWISSGGNTGIEVTIHGANYVEARGDKILPAGEEPPNTAQGL